MHTDRERSRTSAARAAARFGGVAALTAVLLGPAAVPAVQSLPDLVDGDPSAAAGVRSPR